MPTNEANGGDRGHPRLDSHKIRRPQACSSVMYGFCSEPEDVLSTLQIVPTGVADGRRLYIHANSFDDLALRGEEEAKLVYSALVSLPVLKLVHHDVVEDGVGLGRFSELRAADLEKALRERWAGTITDALRRIGICGRGVKPVGLLAQHESVVATCLDSNYYTFATTDPAAMRMYADVLKLKKVRALVAEGSDAYRDLTMVKGRRLVLLGKDNQVVTPSSEDMVREIKTNAMNDLARDLDRIAGAAIRGATKTETSIVRRVQEKSLQAVRRTILHLPPAQPASVRSAFR